MDEKRKYKKKKLWSIEDDQILMEIWKEKIFDLHAYRKNGHIYEEIKQELKKHNCEFTLDEVKIKIHNITSKYKKEKALIASSGGSSSEWPLYPTVHNIFESLKVDNVERLGVENSKQEDNNSEIFTNSNSSDNFKFERTISSLEPAISSPEHIVIEELLHLTSNRESVINKKQKIKFKQELLNKFETMDNKLDEQNVKLEETNAKMYTLEVQRNKLLEQLVTDTTELKNVFLNNKKADAEMYALEVKRTKLMEQFVNDTTELKNALINFLNNKY